MDKYLIYKEQIYISKDPYNRENHSLANKKKILEVSNEIEAENICKKLMLKNEANIVYYYEKA